MPNRASIIAPEIDEIIALPDRDKQLKDVFSGLHPRDIFILCEDLEPQQNAQIVIALGRPLGIELFQQFDIPQKTEISRFFSKPWMAQVLEEMAPDERADFIRTLPPESMEDVYPLIAQAERNDIKRLLQYKEGTAGSVLTTDYASLAPDVTVREALEKLKLQAFNRETIYYVYVIDRDRTLLGFVSLKHILVAESHQLIRNIMSTRIITASVDEDKELVARKLADYDLLAVPVIDDANKLVGIVTYDDIVDVIVQEDTEDIYKYGAAGAYIDYLRAPAFLVARQRILWLLVLVFMGFISGWVLEQYTVQLQAVVALAFFIPLLCGSGGNAGTQSSTVVIRGLATGEIAMADVAAVFRKEVATALIVGSAMGLLAAFRAMVMNRDSRLALSVGLAMVITVLVAATLGALLPILFKRLRLDPALMSGPFIASVVDVVCLFIYLQISTMIIGMA